MKMTHFMLTFVVGCTLAPFATLAQEESSSLVRNGYIDISVLRDQVEKNRDDIQEIKEQLKADVRQTPSESSVDAEPALPSLAIPIVTPDYTSSVVLSSPMPTIHYTPISTSEYVMPSVSTWSAYSSPWEYSPPYVASAPTARVTSATRIVGNSTLSSQKVVQRQRSLSRPMPRCRIVNGRKSCN